VNQISVNERVQIRRESSELAHRHLITPFRNCDQMTIGADVDTGGIKVHHHVVAATFEMAKA